MAMVTKPSDVFITYPTDDELPIGNRRYVSKVWLGHTYMLVAKDVSLHMMPHHGKASAICPWSILYNTGSLTGTIRCVVDDFGDIVAINAREREMLGYLQYVYLQDAYKFKMEIDDE